MKNLPFLARALKVAVCPGHKVNGLKAVAVVGTEVSTVMVCVQVLELPQASVAA